MSDDEQYRNEFDGYAHLRLWSNLPLRRIRWLNANSMLLFPSLLMDRLIELGISMDSKSCFVRPFVVTGADFIGINYRVFDDCKPLAELAWHDYPNGEFVILKRLAAHHPEAVAMSVTKPGLRIDTDGRDVSELPGLWDETDTFGHLLDGVEVRETMEGE